MLENDKSEHNVELSIDARGNSVQSIRGPVGLTEPEFPTDSDLERIRSVKVEDARTGIKDLLKSVDAASTKIKSALRNKNYTALLIATDALKTDADIIGDFAEELHTIGC